MALPTANVLADRAAVGGATDAPGEYLSGTSLPLMQRRALAAKLTRRAPTRIIIAMTAPIRCQFACAGFALFALAAFAAPRPVANPAHMYEPVELKGAPESYDWSKLKRVPHERAVIYAGQPPTHGFNMHGYLTFFDGRYWAAWSCGNEFEDVSGQHVRYATSKDGMNWEYGGIAIPPDPKGEMRYFARGFWVRGNELLVLAARDEAWSVVDGVRKKGKLFGDSLALVAYRYDTKAKAWNYHGVAIDDTINNYPPKQLPSGEWMTTRRDHNQNIFVAIGGVKAFDDWKSYAMPKAADGFDLDEPHWIALADGTIAALFRPTTQSLEKYGSYRLYRAFSYDGGRNWTTPVRTDFPDAKAKSNALRLSNEKFVLVGNTRGGIDPRVPLTVSISDDGVIFRDLRILEDAPTSARFPNRTKHDGYQYPHVNEFNGSVFILYSKNQEDIEILKIAPGELR